MPFDLIVRNGTVVDGTGMARFRADVGVVGRTIAKIGRIRERGIEEIDAEGHFVTPGFIDGHTHLDAQVCWDPMAGSDPWHGVTTVLMGNCSFGVAPCREAEKDLVFRSLERSEDVPRPVLLEGVRWDWETFAGYLDALERLPKGVNYAALVGHGALRTYVMGERAFEEAASEEDLRAMCREMRNAMRAGAFGWSTSRRTAHLTSDGRPVAARQATWDELFALGEVLGDLGFGVIQGLGGSLPNEDVELVRANMRKLALDSGRLLLESGIRNSDVERLPFWASSTRAGGRMMGFVRPKPFELVTGFRVKLPFDTLESWKPFRALPIAAQREILLDSARRAALVRDAETLPSGSMIGAEARPPVYDKMYLMNAPLGHRTTVAQVAAQRGISPVDAIIELSIETDFQQLFTQPDDALTRLDDESLLTMLRHPNTVMAGSDTGAHTTQSIDADFPTTLLGRWVRQREEFTWEEAVRMLTFEPAFVWGFQGRGVLHPGYAADLVVFDPETVGPGTPYTDNGLPGGAPQLREHAAGIHSVIVGGSEILRDNQPTGARPGSVVRGAAYAK